MKKRLSFISLLKRTILCLLLIIVLVVVLVFVFDKYSETDNKVVNAYSDSFWEEKVGFESYTEIIKRVNKYDIKSSEYVYPFDVKNVTIDKFKDYLASNPSIIDEILEKSRYTEELNKLTEYIDSQVDSLNKHVNEIRKWINNKLDTVNNNYVNIVENETPYNYAKNNGYTGTEDEFKAAFATDDEAIGKLIAGGFSSEQEQKNHLSAALLRNPGDLPVDLGDKYNSSTYVNDYIDYIEFSNLQARREEKEKTLPKWDSYYKSLLSYEGIATDYPNKPVLTSKTSSGTTVEFYLDYLTTSFKLVEKDSNGVILQTWYSNPEYKSDAGAKTEEVNTAQQSILNLSYATLGGQTGTYSTFEYAVSTTNLFNDILTPNYSIYIEKDAEGNASKVIVWYKLTKRAIDYTSFPKYIAKEKMEEYLKRNDEIAAKGDQYDRVEILKDEKDRKPISDLHDKSNALALQRLTKDFYKLIPADDIYNEFGFDYYEYSKTHAAMTSVERDFFLRYLYDWCGYTEEDLIDDNNQFNYEVNMSKATYEVAIEYTLSESGLNVCVPGNSIKDDSSFPLNRVDILPYFTATEKSIDGYTIIPDGSGAVLEHNNGKYTFSKYQKRVYTTDLTNTTKINNGSFEELVFPMYAVVNTGNTSGIIAHATENAAQMQLTADISGRQDSYNINYFSAFLREMKQIVVGTASYEQKILEKWTNAMNKNDIAITYSLLSKDELNYSAVAKKYRELLIEEYNIKTNDNTDVPVLDMDVIGAYSYKDNFLGIPYTADDTLTTLEQLETIIKELDSIGVKKMNVFYLGWRDTGLVNESFKKIKVSSLIGSKDKFKELLKDNTDNVTMYPYVSFGEFEKYQESFGKTHYTTHAVDGDVVFRQPYDLNSNIYDKTKAKIYALSPRYYLAFGKTLAKNFKKATDDYNALAIDLLGSTLSGEYRKGKETFKSDAVKNQIATFDLIYKQNGINNLALYSPYDYALTYASVARHVPYQATQYEILDYSIPFYQLLINGIIDYSGESVNANIGKGITEHIMRMIETGSNISFTFTGDSSEKLIQTDYNIYYYTLYTDWLEDVETIYNELSKLDIYSRELINHEYLGNNVYKVVYKNVDNAADEGVTIYLNYSRTTVTLPNGMVVEAKNYAVEK